ncbi:MAG: tetratricopeptide repeat protein [Cyclobacteriaceae bacterium]
MRFKFTIILILAFSMSYAQKKQKGKGDMSEMVVTEMSDSDSLKAEMILIDAQKEAILENYEKAYELLMTVNKLSPENSAVNFKLADVLTKLGRNAEAVVYSQLAVEQDPLNKYYYLLTAEIHKALSNFELAAKTYESMIDKVDDVDSYLFDLAVIYRYMGKYTKALEVYNKVEEIYGPSEVLFREKEQIFKQTKNYDAMATEWYKLIDAYPDELDYKIALIELLFSQDKKEEMEQQLTKLELDDLGRIKGALIRSRIALQNDQIDKAITLAEIPVFSPRVNLNDKLLLINDILLNKNVGDNIEAMSKLCLNLTEQYPDEYVVHAYAGDVLFQLKKAEQARDSYLKAVELEPNRFEVWQNILNIDGSLNDNEAMVAHAESALEYFPNQALLYYFAGTGYLMQKNFRRSVQILEQGKKFALDPILLSIIHGQMGDAYNSMKEYPKSNTAYDAALEQNPENDHVLNNYSYFLSLRGVDLDKAEKMSTKLVASHPNNPTYLDTHGWVLYKLGKFEEAEQVLKKAVDLDEDGTVVEHYGDVLYKLGKVDEAVSQWERASELGGVSKDIQKKIAERKLYE